MPSKAKSGANQGGAPKIWVERKRSAFEQKPTLRREGELSGNFLEVCNIADLILGLMVPHNVTNDSLTGAFRGFLRKAIRPRRGAEKF